MAAIPGPLKRVNETQLTHRLKWAAWEWLYREAQCRCIGMEVRLEGPGGRVVDLAGVGPENTIYVVEVKSSPSDFSRDDHTVDDLARLQSRELSLVQRRQLAERTLDQTKVYAKQARPDQWEEVLAYRLALADWERLQKEGHRYRKRLAGYSTKFHDQRFLNIADFHYIMAPGGMVPRRKLPPLWGLLDEAPSVRIPAPRKEVRKNTGIISNVLRAIARSNTTSLMHNYGVRFTEDGPVFPGADYPQDTGEIRVNPGIGLRKAAG